MSLRLATLLLSAAAPALGAATGTVRRGDLAVNVKVSGTVVPEDVFRLKSTIDGRIESVSASSGSWRDAGQPLATLSDKELAAMIDARGSQNEDFMEGRWSGEYHPTPVRCPKACYVLKVFATARAWVKPQAPLFEAASRLKMVGRVSPGDAPLVRDGMVMTFWSVDDPRVTFTAKVAHLALDDRSEAAETGATFSVNMTPDLFFAPGTQWEGEIVPLKKTDVLMVPTAALIVHDGVPYLPVRVSTGATIGEFTQITAGAEERREILISGSPPRDEPRTARTADNVELEPVRAAAPAVDRPAQRPETTDDKTYGGEDSYGEQ